MRTRARLVMPFLILPLLTACECRDARKVRDQIVAIQKSLHQIQSHPEKITEFCAGAPKLDKELDKYAKKTFSASVEILHLFTDCGQFKDERECAVMTYMMTKQIGYTENSQKVTFAYGQALHDISFLLNSLRVGIIAGNTTQLCTPDGRPGGGSPVLIRGLEDLILKMQDSGRALLRYSCGANEKWNDEFDTSVPDSKNAVQSNSESTKPELTEPVSSEGDHSRHREADRAQ
ncbi:MAG: hypothetical protein ACXWPM_03520 [Bdellovibrionota bacterium]